MHTKDKEVLDKISPLRGSTLPTAAVMLRADLDEMLRDYKGLLEKLKPDETVSEEAVIALTTKSTSRMKERVKVDRFWSWLRPGFSSTARFSSHTMLSMSTLPARTCELIQSFS